MGSLGVPGPASTPCGRAAGGGRAVAPTLTPLVSTHPPKIAIPVLGGSSAPWALGLRNRGPKGGLLGEWEGIFLSDGCSIDSKT